MGEIGIPRREFLYDITYWEALLIMKGYSNRHREMWSAMRWHAFHVIAAMPYVNLREKGIMSPTDLFPFPWEKEQPPVIDEKTAEELQREMDTYRFG